MALTKRSVKGSALSNTELDANFTHLGGDGTYQAPSTKGTAGQVLRMNSGATALEFGTVSGGGGSIGGSTGVDFDDNVKVRFGTSGGNELELYTDGTASYITESGSGHLNIQGQEIKFKNASGTSLLEMNSAQVELHHSGSKKLETYNSGIQTTGTINVNNAYTLPTSDGTNGQVLQTNGSGVLSFATAGGGSGISNIVEDTTPQLGGDLDNNGKNIKISAASTGSGNNRLTVGPNAEFSLYHNASLGTYMVESGSGSMRFMASDFKLQNFAGSHEYIVMTDGGSVAISHGNGIKLETTTAGIKTTGTVNVNNAYTLPTSDGTSGQVLQTNGSGVLSFATAGGGDPDLYRDNNNSGVTPSATGGNAVAIGNSSSASGSKGLAVGSDTTSVGTGASAIGWGSSANGTNGLGLSGGDSDGDYALAIGKGSTNNQAKAQANGAVAIGAAYASGVDSLAINIADNSNSYGAQSTHSVAIGYHAYAHTEHSAMAIGYNAQSSANLGISLGLNARSSSGQGAIALGQSNARGTNGLAAAIGSNSSSYGSVHDNGVAIGFQAVTTAAKQIALGSSTAQVKISGAYTLPTADGTSGQVLQTDGSGVLSFATSGGGGVTGFTSADNTSSPNNTVNVASLSVNSSSTNAGAAIVPKGTGAFMLRIPDATATGGNSRGSQAIDLSLSGNNADKVASGQMAIAIGNTVKAAGQESVSIGYNNYANGTRSFAHGYDSNAGANYSYVFGSGGSGSAGQYGICIGDQTSARANSFAAIQGRADVDHGWSFGADRHNNTGRISGTYWGETSNATPTDISSNGTGQSNLSYTYNHLPMAWRANPGQNSNWLSFLCTGYMVATNNTDGTVRTWEFSTLWKRNSTTDNDMTNVATTITQTHADSGMSSTSWTITSGTHDRMDVTVTGLASKNINWTLHYDAKYQRYGS